MGRRKRISNPVLLAAARDVFVRDGAAGSTAEIAARAGVSEATLFKRFSTKAALFIAAMAPPRVDAEAIVAEADETPDARAALTLIGERALAYFREALPLAIPLISNPLIGFEGLRRHFEFGGAQALTGAVAGFIARRVSAGEMRSTDPLASAMALIALVHSIAQFEVMGMHAEAMPPAGVRALIDALWDGLAPTKEPQA
ncbi:MAG TPA: helix-turn-helix domain-containing protein [Caulobacteraceae bacterium]|nr:helix-turn-helix domain-containing protein [Caulobacteraceae bacterium]